MAHGFARVQCESCKDELLVAFSSVTAVHRVEQVLPQVPYRQWTLSFPHRVRWVLLKEAGVLSQVLTLFLRAVFALLPQAGAEEASAGKEAAARTERMKQGTPRVDWAELLSRTFDFDVFACVRCGGRRRVLAYVKGARGVRAILKHLGLPTAGARLAPARGPPQAAWC